jgi:hypothetical protein
MIRQLCETIIPIHMGKTLHRPQKTLDSLIHFVQCAKMPSSTGAILWVAEYPKL